MRFRCITATVWLVTGCASQPSVDLIAEREALRDRADAYYEVVNGGDLDAFAAFYAQGGTMMPPNADPVSGEAAIRGHAEGFRSIADFAAVADLQTVDVSPDARMGYSVARVVITGASDGAPVRETLRDVHIWTRDADGTWRIAIDVWNSLAPAGEMD